MTSASAPSATTWDAWQDEGRGFQVITDTELERFALHFPLHNGHTAVDVGCGNGHFSRQLHRFGYQVTGLDFSTSALTAARRTPLSGVQYLHHDLTQGDPPGLPAHGIDLVVCRLVLPFLHEPTAWVRRVRDLWLRPGGRMYAVIPVVGEDTTQPGGMTEEQIADVAHGWAHSLRYDLNGTSAALALRAAFT
ncbi:class I SAM-dependent methyltransferase [Streptomyces sp. NPDC002564]|uniref:class I SAM-dependent methyltransferase n=1 Tax=Streptomyces sp. NPDC002564 TaxID=3364649 RepID=UPI00369B073D